MTYTTYQQYSNETSLLTTWREDEEGAAHVIDQVERQDDNPAPSFREDDK